MIGVLPSLESLEAVAASLRQKDERIAQVEAENQRLRNLVAEYRGDGYLGQEDAARGGEGK